MHLLMANATGAVRHAAQQLIETASIALTIKFVTIGPPAPDWSEIEESDFFYLRCAPGTVDGWSKRWAERTLSTTLIFEAPFATPGEVVRAFRAGCSDVVLKTPNLTELSGVLRRNGLLPEGETTLKELMKNVKRFTLPSLSDIGPQLKAIDERIRDPNLVMDDLIEVLTADPALVSSVLHVANSPFWIGARKVTTLRDACVRLGTTQLGEIAKQVLVGRAFQLNDPILGDLPGQMWSCAVGTAACARTLAPHVDLSPSVAHAAALLHNIGEIVVLANISAASLVERSHPGFRNQVIDAYVACHQDVGARVLHRMGVPQRVIEIARAHGVRKVPRNNEPSTRLELLCLLCWELTHKAGFTYPRRDHRFDPEPIAERLSLSLDTARTVVDEALSSLQLAPPEAVEA
ncbi:MAG: HDOD domain-containing protein [Myxococcota bacterium]